MLGTGAEKQTIEEMQIGAKEEPVEAATYTRPSQLQGAPALKASDKPASHHQSWHLFPGPLF